MGGGEFNKKFHVINEPVIGNNCYIGPGAKLFGGIIIGDNVSIGVNAVVNRYISSESTAVGVPGKILQNKDMFKLLLYGDNRFKSK